MLPFSFYDLVEACAGDECPVCALLIRDADRYLDSLLYEFANDPGTHAAFRAGRGLCNLHSWQLTRYDAGVLGIAILQTAVIDEVLRLIDEAPAQPSGGLARMFGSGANGPSALADRLEPEGPCLVCQTLAQAEASYLEALVTHLGDARLEAAFRRSAGLCLPHFRTALRGPGPGAALDRLIALQTERWRQLKAELLEFQSKSDYKRAHEVMGRERDSWRRAIGSAAGAHAVFGLRRPPGK